MSKVTVSTKGHLIDAHCKYISGNLVEHCNGVYDCTLNQTNILVNNNKFYIMQIINYDSNKYCVFIRYGRIGERGTINHKDFSSKLSAIDFFEKQFRAKTGNRWEDRNNFVKKDGKYFLSQIEVADVSEEESEMEKSSESDTELDQTVIDFVKFITNTTYMKNTLVQLEIDTEKMPLGKISQGQIDKAYEILNKINQNLHDKNKLVKLSSEYYTLIPYVCGRNAPPPIIDSTKLIGKNINLLNELSQMVFGTKAVTKLKKDKGNLSKLYQNLNTNLIPLNEGDGMYPILVDYLKNSMAPTHNFKYEVLNIFEVNRQSEKDIYDAHTKKLHNKTLLFHGTRVSNLVGIFNNGLLCDPSKIGINVCVTGKMFGLGLYFANSASKSIQYCAYDTSDNIACLFVAEVALGKQLMKKNADVSLTAKNIPKGYHSTYGMGKSSFEEYDEYDDNTRIPAGRLKKIPERSDCCLLYDEFIVYRDEQVNLRYIIKLKIMNK